VYKPNPFPGGACPFQGRGLSGLLDRTFDGRFMSAGIYFT
jgi:hypothetical protein